ncbi:MAG: hypothetical protein RBT41_08805, partial [Clostridia bacterium]|nr:hypothetical protein [Clostridia bacterium]
DLRLIGFGINLSAKSIAEKFYFLNRTGNEFVCRKVLVGLSERVSRALCRNHYLDSPSNILKQQMETNHGTKDA